MGRNLLSGHRRCWVDGQDPTALNCQRGKLVGLGRSEVREGAGAKGQHWGGRGNLWTVPTRVCRNSDPDTCLPLCVCGFACAAVKGKTITQDWFHIKAPCFSFPSLPCVLGPPQHRSSVSWDQTAGVVLGLSQSLASYSSSRTSSTPSLRKGKKFSKCLFFGCSEISFLCHLLVISVSWLLRT
ncbi:hypothetical protein HJG60_008642 [Phyllostomus discolor]|uniref:Uncharacterized protein n=1 Tax=Phyllostomus discolor TaxID=89673 RepID=A0A833Z3U0_9CHIR|nr:hypothetical protein HJG60_008642 [Phyllostomus discolor]